MVPARCWQRLSGQGFKILLDLFASAPRPLRFAEVPFNFRPRLHGESKLDAMVAWEYLMLLLEKLVGPAVPVRFLLFSLIGGLGVGTHLLTLWFGTHVLFVAFAVAQAAATIVAMTGNFLLNNLFTYRDRRLRGRRLLTGLLSFYAVCGVGTVANVGIAAHLVYGHTSWWLAGLAGAAVSVVWNYAMSSIFTWSPRARRPACRRLCRPCHKPRRCRLRRPWYHASSIPMRAPALLPAPARLSTTRRGFVIDRASRGGVHSSVGRAADS